MSRVLPPLAYLALATGLTWPAAIRPVTAVPGAQRTDLWDGLWSLWFFAERLRQGAWPTRVDGYLDHPRGGTLWVADPLNALLATPLTWTVGPAAAWSVLVLAHVAFAGLAAHALARAVLRSPPGTNEPAAWFAGAAYASAPILAAHIHNGATEAVGTGWLPLAALACLRAREGGVGRVLLAGVALAIVTIGSWYYGVCAFLFAAALILAGASNAASRPRNPPKRATGVARDAGFCQGDPEAPGGVAGGGKPPAPGSSPRLRVLLAAALGAALAAPVAYGAHRAATAPDNVVGIKTDKEMATVRRTIGPADPVAFVAPLGYRSPDFRELSRYGEQYVHAPYLGWVALLLASVGALSAARRVDATARDVDRRALIALGAVGAGCAVLACGPVLARFGSPVILPGRLAIPLPYLLLEALPGFSSLSLTWRLAQGATLAVSVLAAVPLARTPRAAALATTLALLEARTVAPTADLPAHSDATSEAPLLSIASEPEGALMNYPVTGGLSFLYDQVAHRKPLTGGLNFPNNNASRKVWKTMLEHRDDAPGDFLSATSATARAVGVRYVVVRLDPNARPDMHDAAIRALKHASPPVAEAPGLRVHRLY